MVAVSRQHPLSERWRMNGTDDSFNSLRALWQNFAQFSSLPMVLPPIPEER